MQLFAELGFPYESVFETYDFWLPRVRVEAEYLAPALMSDWLRLRTHIEHVGASSVRWQTVFFNERTSKAGAVVRFIVATIDGQQKKSRPLPNPCAPRCSRACSRPRRCRATSNAARRGGAPPPPGGIVVRVRAALTDGTDLKTYRRGHPKMPMPTRFGHEFSGDVAAVGDGVSAFAPGDAVMCVHTAPCGKCFWCRRAEEELRKS